MPASQKAACLPASISHLQELATDVKGKMRIVKIDTEKYPNLAAQYGIEGLPTLCIFQNGKLVQRLEGFYTAPQLLPALQPFL